MKHLKLFEENKTSQVNSLLAGTSSEFWEMVKSVNWKKAIDDYHATGDRYNEIFDSIQGKLYLKYEYFDIIKFYREYGFLYEKLYSYFDKYYDTYDYGVSDDGFSDLLSSIIGKGKSWTIRCIKNPKIPKKMSNTNDYMENFVYLLQVDYSEYYKIRSKHDPNYSDESSFYSVSDKYNL